MYEVYILLFLWRLFSFFLPFPSGMPFITSSFFCVYFSYTKRKRDDGRRLDRRSLAAHFGRHRWFILGKKIKDGEKETRALSARAPVFSPFFLKVLHAFPINLWKHFVQPIFSPWSRALRLKANEPSFRTVSTCRYHSLFILFYTRSLPRKENSAIYNNNLFWHFLSDVLL